jgi:ribonucleoside-diphosphate reductase alpha chain
MDSFATAASLCLQHGVPLKVLCEKFAHTRFEPSGWTGDEQIGYAKSLMDYLFRWMQLRFLSGHQLSLFNLKSLAAQPSATAPSLSFRSAAEESASASLPLSASASPSNAAILSDALDTAAILSGAQAAQPSVPVTGTVNAPDNIVLPNEPSGPWALDPDPGVPGQLAGWGGDPSLSNDRRAPQQGIAPDLTASYDLSSRAERSAAEGPASGLPSVPDRGLYHAATAMKSMYNMGDAPSCSTCGSIMTRNGSCYRCMECGSTSGCS